MESVILIVHLMVALAMVGVVLLQRSEGGALGIGGGGGGGGLMSGRGTANLLTRATAILAAAFFATSIGLSLLGRSDEASVFDRFDPNVIDLEGGSILPLGDERQQLPSTGGQSGDAAAPAPESNAPSVPLSQ